MKIFRRCVYSAFLVMAASGLNFAHADQYSDTVDVFKKSPAVKPFIDNCYGYAVLPTVGI